MRMTKAIAECVGVSHSREMWTLVENRRETTFTEPAMPCKMAGKAALEKCEMLLKVHMEDKKRHKREKAKVFRLIMGQCLVAMKNKVESLPDYQDLEDEDDVVGLLKKMKDLVCATDYVQHECWMMQSVMRKLVSMRQEPKESLANFG